MGLIYAGGRAGIDSGLLPWKPERLLLAIQRCFKASIRDLRAQENIDRKVQKILRRKLQGPRVVERQTESSFGPDSYDGYYERLGGKITYVIKIRSLTPGCPRTPTKRLLCNGCKRPGIFVRVINSGRKVLWQPAARSARLRVSLVGRMTVQPTMHRVQRSVWSWCRQLVAVGGASAPAHFLAASEPLPPPPIDASSCHPGALASISCGHHLVTIAIFLGFLQSINCLLRWQIHQ